METFPISRERLDTMSEEELKEWCNVTRTKILKCSFFWTLHNINDYRSLVATRIYRSEVFSVNPEDGAKWCMEFREEDNEKAWLYLKLVVPENEDFRVSAFIKASILTPEGSLYLKLDYGPYTFQKRRNLVSFPSFDNQYKSYARDERFDKKITILCEIFESSRVSSIEESLRMKLDLPDSRLIEEIGSLHEDERFSDVRIIVNGSKKFRAHKAILVARSKVFADMFAHETEEQLTSQVDLNDMDLDVFNEMLRFIYTGRVSSADLVDLRLLGAAESYDLKGLKAICEVILAEKLEINNSVDFLIQADLHKAERLKTRAMRYIIENLRDVINTNGYETMVESHPRLTDAILRALANEESSGLFTAVEKYSELGQNNLCEIIAEGS